MEAGCSEIVVVMHTYGKVLSNLVYSPGIPICILFSYVAILFSVLT